MADGDIGRATRRARQRKGEEKSARWTRSGYLCTEYLRSTEYGHEEDEKPICGLQEQRRQLNHIPPGLSGIQLTKIYSTSGQPHGAPMYSQGCMYVQVPTKVPRRAEMMCDIYLLRYGPS